MVAIKLGYFGGIMNIYSFCRGPLSLLQNHKSVILFLAALLAVSSIVGCAAVQRAGERIIDHAVDDILTEDDPDDPEDNAPAPSPSPKPQGGSQQAVRGTLSGVTLEAAYREAFEEMTLEKVTKGLNKSERQAAALILKGIKSNLKNKDASFTCLIEAATAYRNARGGIDFADLSLNVTQGCGFRF